MAAVELHALPSPGKDKRLSPSLAAARQLVQTRPSLLASSDRRGKGHSHTLPNTLQRAASAPNFAGQLLVTVEALSNGGYSNSVATVAPNGAASNSSTNSKSTSICVGARRVESLPPVHSARGSPCSSSSNSKCFPVEFLPLVPSACGSSSALGKNAIAPDAEKVAEAAPSGTGIVSPFKSEALTLLPRTSDTPLRVNISALGHGGYRLMYMKAIEKYGCQYVEDAADDTCDIYIITPAITEELHRRLKKLQAGCRVNLFPGMFDVCEKVTFCRSVRQLIALCPRLRDYIPSTWILPDELHAVFGMLCEAGSTGSPFIIKPEYGMQGNGIFIVRTRVDLEVALVARCLRGPGSKGHVCQRYLTNPLTLDGYKFDLRLYLIVDSFAPLQAVLCKEGLARFCTTPYTPPSAANIGVKTGHLTNYALNCKHEAFARTQTGANPEDASKRLLSKTLEQIAAASCGRFDEEQFWSQAEEISRLLLIAISPGVIYSGVQPMNDTIPSQSYQVLGLDILLDSDYRPWLLEVNSMPAMDVETAVPAPDATPSVTNIQTPMRKSKSSSSILIGDDSRGARLQNKKQSLRERPKDVKSIRFSRGFGHERGTSSAEEPVDEAGQTTLSSDTGYNQPSQSKLVRSDEIAGSQGPKPVKRKKRRRRSQSSQTLVEPQPSIRYTDPWGGYQPSQMRRRSPWPEICRCMAHGQPHRHAVCEVDMDAKTLAICTSFSLIVGSPDHNCTMIQCSGEMSRIESVLHRLACFCSSLSRGRGGLCVGSLRKALQSSDDVYARNGSGRLGQHDLDTVLSAPGIGNSFDGNSGGGAAGPREAAPAAYEQLSLHTAFGMLFEVARRCCCKGPASSTDVSPLEQLEWLASALGRIPASTAKSSSSTFPTVKQGLHPKGVALRAIGPSSRRACQNSCIGE